jgi:hypothetical protein
MTNAIQILRALCAKTVSTISARVCTIPPMLSVVLWRCCRCSRCTSPDHTKCVAEAASAAATAVAAAAHVPPLPCRTASVASQRLRFWPVLREMPCRSAVHYCADGRLADERPTTQLLVPILRLPHLSQLPPVVRRDDDSQMTESTQRRKPRYTSAEK